MTEQTPSTDRDQLHLATAKRVSDALLTFAAEMSTTFHPVETAKMFLVAVVQIVVPACGPAGAAALLRDLAARIEKGEAMTV